MTADGHGSAAVEHQLQGDAEAFGHLYEQYAERIHDYILRTTRDAALADDLTQDTFVRAFRSRSTLRDTGKLRPWLFAIAHNVVVKHVNRTRLNEDVDARADLAALEAGPEAATVSRESADLVWAAARSLESRQYEMLDLTLRQELTNPEVAEVLGVDAGHVAVLVHRAHEALGNAVRYLLVARRRTHCQRLAELVPTGVRELTREQRASVDHHMRRCPRCQDMASTLTAPAAILGGLAVVAAPHLFDEAHRQALTTKLAATKLADLNSAQTSSRALARLRRPLRGASIPTIAAVSVAAVVVLGGSAFGVTRIVSGGRSGHLAATRATPSAAAASSVPGPTATSSQPPATPAPRWSSASPIPVAWQSVGNGAVTGSDGRIYLFGDCLTPTTANSAFAYTPSTDSWATLAPMPVPGCGSAVWGSDGRIYVITGGDNRPNSTEAYAPASNTWVVLAAMPLPPTGGRNSFAAARGDDGRIYVFGGNDETGGVVVATVDAYSPSTNTWTAVAPMPTARCCTAAVAGSDGRIYVMGGTSSGGKNNASFPINTVEAYAPATNTWTTVAPLLVPSDDFAGALGSDGRIYAIASDKSATGVGMEAYSLATGTWSFVTPMSGNGFCCVAAASTGDGRIYVFDTGADNRGVLIYGR